MVLGRPCPCGDRYLSTPDLISFRWARRLYIVKSMQYYCTDWYAKLARTTNLITHQTNETWIGPLEFKRRHKKKKTSLVALSFLRSPIFGSYMKAQLLRIKDKHVCNCWYATNSGPFTIAPAYKTNFLHQHHQPYVILNSFNIILVNGWTPANQLMLVVYPIIYRVKKKDAAGQWWSPDFWTIIRFKPTKT